MSRDIAWNYKYDETSCLQKTCGLKVEQLDFLLPPLLLRFILWGGGKYYLFVSSANMILMEGEISYTFTAQYKIKGCPKYQENWKDNQIPERVPATKK